MALPKIETPVSSGATDQPNAPQSDPNYTPAAGEASAQAAGYTVQHTNAPPPPPDGSGLMTPPPPPPDGSGLMTPPPPPPDGSGLMVHTQPSAHNEATGGIKNYKPSILDQIKDVFRQGDPNYSTRTVNDPDYGEMTILSPVHQSEEEAKAHPTVTALGEFISSMTSPVNSMMLLMSGVAGELGEMATAKAVTTAAPALAKMGLTEAAIKSAPAMFTRLVSAGFTAQMIHGIMQNNPALIEAWNRGDAPEVERLFAHHVLDAGMAFLSAQHAATGKPGETSGISKWLGETADAIADKVRQKTSGITDIGMTTRNTTQNAQIPVRSTTLAGKAAGQLVSPDVMKDIAQEKTAPAVQKAVGNIVREATGSTAYTISRPEAGDSFGLAGHSANLRAQATPVFDRIDELYDGALARAKDKMSSANGDQEQYAEGRAEQNALYDKARNQLADEGMDVDHADQQYRRSIQVEKMRAAFERSINPDTGDLSGKRLSSEIGKLVQKGEKGAFERGDLTQEHVAALKEVANIMKDQEKPPTQYIYGAAKTIAALTGVHLGGFGGLVEGTIGESVAEAVSRRVSDKLFADALAEPSAASRLPKALKTGDVQPVVSALQKSDPTWLDRTKAFVKNVLIKGTRGEAGAPGSVNEEDHSPELRDFSKEYTGGKDIDTAKVEPDTRRAAISDAYDKMEHAPNDPAVKKTYDALINETKAQWEGLKARGYKVDTTSNPEHYKNAQDMIDDVRNNKHLTVWDGGAPPADHPLSTVDPDSGMTNNTLFRAVHDILGHAKEGNDFSEKGEENAFRQHSQMYSKDAQAALATETRGQAASVFHHNGEFPEQKAAILPERFHGGNEPVTLHHWSNVDDLTETNPEKMGTGKAGREMARANEPGFLKRTNFGDDSYKERAIQGQKNHYTAQVDPAKYYDIEKDPEGIWQEALRTQGATAAERAVHDAGYDGYRNGGEYASFEKVPVRQAGAHATNNASGESAASVEAQNRLKRQNAQGVRVYDVDSRMAGSKNAWHPVMATVDRVDQQAQPFHHLVEIDKDGHTQVLNSGEGALPLPPDARIRALVGQAAGEAPTTSVRQPQTTADIMASPEHRDTLGAHEVGTRLGTKTVKGEKSFAPNDPTALSGLDSLNAANSRGDEAGNGKMTIKQKLVAAFNDYDNTGLTFTPEELKSPDTAIEKIINHLVDNNKWLYNQMPPVIRDAAQKWYEFAHQTTYEKAQESGLSQPQVAGVYATLSPQNPWHNNKMIADRLIDLYKNERTHEWSPAMDKKASEIAGVKTASPEFKQIMNAIRGKKFDELADVAKGDKQAQLGLEALWLRVLDEAESKDRQIKVYGTDGNVINHEGGRMAWSSLSAMSKALDIIKNGRNVDGTPDLELISRHLGEGNKVRNFYNNIINPWSDKGHFTADTHQVGAALLQPVSSKSPAVAHNFGGSAQGYKGSNPGKNAAAGVKGTYPVYHEAGVRASNDLGVDYPRQFQSITWEGIRSLMGDDKKTPELKKAVDIIWKRHREGDLTLDEARNKIMEASGGFTKPEWMTQEQWDAEDHPNKAENVLANRSPENEPKQIIAADAARQMGVKNQKALDMKAKKAASAKTKKAGK